jgi:hypothetical protein
MRKRFEREERRVFTGVRRDVREVRRVGGCWRSMVRIAGVWEADEALGGVGGREGMKKEGMQAMVDWVYC